MTRDLRTRTRVLFALAAILIALPVALGASWCGMGSACPLALAAASAQTRIVSMGGPACPGHEAAGSRPGTRDHYTLDCHMAQAPSPWRVRTESIPGRFPASGTSLSVLPAAAAQPQDSLARAYARATALLPSSSTFRTSLTGRAPPRA